MEERVRENSATKINYTIDKEIKESIEFHSGQGRQVLNNRIETLNKEWDVERALELQISATALTGIALTAALNKKWLIFPAVVIGFFIQHAIQGWCPPLPVYRKLGFRTTKEIERERYALKVLRGDFDNIDKNSGTQELIQAIQK